MLDAGEALPHTLFSSAADSTSSYDDSDQSADRYSGRGSASRNTNTLRLENRVGIINRIVARGSACGRPTVVGLACDGGSDVGEGAGVAVATAAA